MDAVLVSSRIGTGPGSTGWLTEPVDAEQPPVIAALAEMSLTPGFTVTSAQR